MRLKTPKALMLNFFALCFFAGAGPVLAQYSIKGKIIDAESFKPLSYATVFVSNSSFGEITDEEGLFEIQIPEGEHNLVISFMGYEPFSYSLSTRSLRNFYEFRLLQQSIDLEEREVMGRRDATWYKNLQIFERYFLGISNNGIKSKIHNPEVLILDAESNTSKLKVTAREILEIKNPNLGFQIKYVLLGFEYDFSTQQVTYSGYPYFVEADIPKRRLKKVTDSREKAYLGSIMHFVRSLYRGNSNEEGFEVYSTEKALNPNWTAPKSDSTQLPSGIEKAIGQTLIRQGYIPQWINLPDQPIPDPNEMIQTTSDGKIFMTYAAPIYVVYQHEAEDPEFHPYSLRNISPLVRTLGLSVNKELHDGEKLSQVSMLNMRAKAVQLFVNGSYFHPYDIFVEGYMAWEKIGDLLPFEYEHLPKKQRP